MVKPEWGEKRTCQSCGVPFYDLKKKIIECPNCSAQFDLSPQTKPRRPTPYTPKTQEEKAILPTDVKGGDVDFKDTATSDLDADIDDDDDDDSMIEDTSDLGGGDDEIPKITEKPEYGVEE